MNGCVKRNLKLKLIKLNFEVNNKFRNTLKSSYTQAFHMFPKVELFFPTNFLADHKYNFCSILVLTRENTRFVTRTVKCHVCIIYPDVVITLTPGGNVIKCKNVTYISHLYVYESNVHCTNKKHKKTGNITKTCPLLYYTTHNRKGHIYIYIYLSLNSQIAINIKR